MEIHRHEIIIGGKGISCAARVLTWHEHGIEFKAGEGYNKRRRKEIDICVWHWTGGEGHPKTMAATLRRRKLGVEFAIDVLGNIWQFCDPLLVDTADAGIVNARSVGIEVINRGRAAIGKKRKNYSCSMRGKSATYAHFHLPQISAAVALADSLSSVLPIPRRVPVDSEYLAVLGRTMHSAELDAFQGHLGHFHVSSNKIDPGFDLLEVLRCCWAAEL